MKETDYIIVGQGITGSLLAFELIKCGVNFFVIDENKKITSSKMCGGMFTPVSGKRMTKANGTDEQIEITKKIFSEIENYFGISLVNEINMYTVFGSVKEQNDLTLKMDDNNFSKHINLNPIVQKNIRQPLGAFEISGSGHINVNLLLDTVKEKLMSENKLIQSKFDYDLLSIADEKFVYKNIITGKIIFCEGVGAAQNKFFADLPLKFCKGETMIIKCDELKLDRVIKKGIGLAAIGGGLFKVGATYEWNDLSNEPSEKGRISLQKKLDDILELPYEVISQQAAVRPTTRTREPIVLQHPEFKNMFLLNGLGTKGVTNGPWVVKELLKKFNLNLCSTGKLNK